MGKLRAYQGVGVGGSVHQGVIMNFLKQAFNLTAEAMRARLLKQAEIELIEHRAAAEYSLAMSAMLHERVERLRKECVL